ncbi:hypothetical protein AVEN_28252-1 [Araneus ventricosus]|uniref:Uncharacterized protein n=1 Tax=Araneus ventricosus TaxID=182803 RepID=A0A4Y2WZ39_ARAVE|nr:hypothetical protein AVEN_231549-1 [Araneus ventricosus]GBO42138.1 hypothetical protein AVEN_255496-1 [Araneus ventricosus]GBO42140.1 hypothetical protein AVEN_274475-1 [Araneus ventricosus]GBO42141.1 hypothetical protein AVEN_28252-1 [Araneus ventricosus]
MILRLGITNPELNRDCTHRAPECIAGAGECVSHSWVQEHVSERPDSAPAHICQATGGDPAAGREFYFFCGVCAPGVARGARCTLWLFSRLLDQWEESLLALFLFGL